MKFKQQWVRPYFVRFNMAAVSSVTWQILLRWHHVKTLYRKEIPELLYGTAPCMVSSAIEFQLEVFRYLPTRNTQTNANKMHQQSSRALRHFMRLYLHAQTEVHVHLMNHGYFDHGENPNTPIGAPCWDKDGAGSGISGLYLGNTHKMTAEFAVAKISSALTGDWGIVLCTATWKMSNACSPKRWQPLEGWRPLFLSLAIIIFDTVLNELSQVRVFHCSSYPLFIIDLFVDWNEQKH